MVPYLLIDYQLWYLTSWMTASSASGQVLYDPVLGYLFNLSPYRRLLHFGCVLLELNRPEASQPIDHILPSLCTSFLASVVQLPLRALNLAEGPFYFMPSYSDDDHSAQGRMEIVHWRVQQVWSIHLFLLV